MPNQPGVFACTGSQAHCSSSQLQPLTQLAAQQPCTLGGLVSQPALWLAYSPLAVILLLLLCSLSTPFWSSLLASAASTSICVLYAAQQRLLLGRQEQLAVRRTKKAVVAAASAADAQQQGAGRADRPNPPSKQIVLTLLGAEITDSMSPEGPQADVCFGCCSCLSECVHATIACSLA